MAYSSIGHVGYALIGLACGTSQGVSSLVIYLSIYLIMNIEKISSLRDFCKNELGKGIVNCNDTPGFIGNRIGVYAMQVAMTEAFKMKMSIEEADAVFGRPMGIPYRKLLEEGGIDRALNKIKEIEEFNIGHFIIGESIFIGLSSVIKKFKKIIKN